MHDLEFVAPKLALRDSLADRYQFASFAHTIGEYDRFLALRGLIHAHPSLSKVDLALRVWLARDTCSPDVDSYPIARELFLHNYVLGARGDDRYDISQEAE